MIVRSFKMQTPFGSVTAENGGSFSAFFNNCLFHAIFTFFKVNKYGPVFYLISDT